jgi:predicted phage-related endonuclease
VRRIGGSDIPKLLGISPYGGPFEVYQRVVEGTEAPWKPVMERGAAVEGELRAFGQNFLGLELEDSASDYHDHPTLEFARAQVDDVARFQGMPVAVDYKSVSRWAKGWGPEGSDEVPEHIRAQMAWELLCTDRELGLLIAGFGDDMPPPALFHVANVITYQIQRDEQFERYCILVAQEFWEAHVLPGKAPAPTILARKKRKAS